VSETIDARGLACPQPVIKTREALASDSGEIEVLVDNNAARENVTRFASGKGCDVRVEEESGFYRLFISSCREARALGQGMQEAAGETRNLIVLSCDVMGSDEELGRILIRTFLDTMCEGERLPWRLVLFNRGILLALEEAETMEALRNLEGIGVEVLVCGTCLDYFKAKDRLGAGRVSNMYEIVETMLMATNCVTI